MLPITRREFVVGAATTGILSSIGDFSFLNGLPAVSAAEAKPPSNIVQLTPDMEPLVRLLEDTPREKLLESVIDKMRSGVGYQQLLAAVFLAGVRGIKPRPVGFKFHAVLVVNSAHLASLAMPDKDRWLPLFWAIDNYKSSQARNKQEGGWMMPPVDESKLPSAEKARERFIAAMDNWDEEDADRAIASLVRSAGAGEIIELFWRFGARDFRSIGHKAIYVANAWRTLETIGWRHAEPIMRSLAFALLAHEGSNPAKRDDEADRPGRDNLKRLAEIRKDWQRGKIDPEAAADLLATLRAGSAADGSAKVVELLNRQIDPASIWDGIFLDAGELLMRQPGIVGLHCVTTANALHYAYQASSDDKTRRFLMLQAAAFLPMFRKAMKSRGRMREDVRIDTLERADTKATGPAAIEEIFADVSKDRMAAARKTLAAMQSNAVDAAALMTAARRLVFNKGNDSHDYKFSSAALEDFYHMTPHWRARFLATSMFNLRGSADRDNSLIKRARAALTRL